MVTLDASIWLASLSPTEPGHATSRALVARVLERHIPTHQPVLFVIEVCATIARRTGDRDLAVEVGRAALRWPHLVLHELDHLAAADAANVAVTCSLRGADAVYVATARQAGSVLVTLDREMWERGSSVVEVATPDEWMASGA